MQLTSKRAIVPRAESPGLQSLQSRAPWAVAIRQRYGDSRQFMAAFAPTTQRYCLNNLPAALAPDGPPTLARVIKTYGDEAATAWIYIHVAECAGVMVDEGDRAAMSRDDIERVAQEIATGARGRRLNVASVLAFFAKLKSGEMETYGRLTAKRMLEHWHRYIPIAAREEDRLIAARERAEAEERRRRWAEEAAPEEVRRAKAAELGAYCRERGLPAPPFCLEALAQQEKTDKPE